MKLFALLLIAFPLFSFSQNWEEVAPVPAAGRDDAVAFSLGGAGFVVTGNQGGFSESNRLWKYDPLQDVWEEKAAFPGTPRQYAGSFTIGGEAYVIMGISPDNQPLSDVWKYNSASDQWTQLDDFPGEARWSLFTFATPVAGYAGTGSTLTALLKDAWKYDPATDNWTQLADFPGGTRRESVSFSIGEKGFVGLGYSILGGSGFLSDLYEWNELSGAWTELADLPGVARSYANAIGTNGFGYVGTGQDAANGFHADCYRFDPVFRTWTVIADFPVAIKGMSAFAIEDTPYFVTGITESSIRVPSCRKLTDVPKAAEAFLAFYPNPSNGNLVVKALNGSNIQLFAADGRLVREMPVDQQQTAFLQNLPHGSYQLRVTSGETVFSENVIVY